ncbi:FHA domain-containing protein [Cryptosporidium andersoni]|uniref:FHA domain-containing protein n=1 Tax=Cryptosporidium andersoni TaxID=117008 RepID=A0A1J4MVL4_9CRYT|nr:FHA domain-containing protein [Cryptosporidium andersoni]
MTKCRKKRIVDNTSNYEEVVNFCQNNEENLEVSDIERNSISSGSPPSVENYKLENCSLFSKTKLNKLQKCSKNKEFVKEDVKIVNRDLDFLRSYDIRNSTISPFPYHTPNKICMLESLSGKRLFRIDVCSEGLKIGRSSESDLPSNINHCKLLILSRNHACIYCKYDNFGSIRNIYLVDCGSVNGTFVNNKKIKHVILKNGDIISFGSKYKYNEKCTNISAILSEYNPWTYRIII